MQTRPWSLAFVAAGFIGIAGTPDAFGQSILGKPSVAAAQRFEAQNDFASAIQIYNELLMKHPNDRRILKLMVHCHDLMVQDEIRVAKIENKDTPAPQLPETISPPKIAETKDDLLDNFDTQPNTTK